MPAHPYGATHVVIPDTQAKAGVPTDHLAWVGQYVVDQFAGRENVKVIHLGDHADMPSLSSYDKGKLAMEGRRYQDDIDAANTAFDILNAPIDDYQRRHRKQGWELERRILLGNHEDRICRAVESDPQLKGTLSLGHLNYEAKGWRVHGFLQVVDLDGISYSHYFYNPMTGHPYGGQAATRIKTIGRSFTMGHQQTLDYTIRFVAGRSQHGLVAGACYLHNEDYKGPQGNAHWRGIIVCHEVDKGSYDPMFVSLDYLCRRYEGMRLEQFRAKRGVQ